MGMEDSHHVLATLDIQTDIHLAKAEHLEAKKICDIAITKTSPTCSLRYSAHFLVQRAYIGILATNKETEILDDMDAAEAVYAVYDIRRILLCSWVRAELELSRGNLGIANFAFKECLSRSLGVYTDIPLLCLAALGDPRHEMDMAWNTLVGA
jgi:hypothetical protein